MARWVMVMLLTVQVALQTEQASLNYFTDSNFMQATAPKVVYPRVVNVSQDGTLLLVLTSQTATFYLQLTPYTGLVSDNLTLVVRHSESNYETPESNAYRDTRLYQGRALSHQGALAALSLSDRGRTVSGIVATKEGRFVVRPWHHVSRRSPPPSSNDVTPHVMFRLGDEEHEFCGVDSQDVHQQELVSDNETESSHRQRRAPPGHKVIETAIFADSHLYKVFADRSSGDPTNELIQTVLAIMNEVQLIYNYDSMKTKFKMVIVKLEILKPGVPAPDTANGDIDEYLDNFCTWQALKNTALSRGRRWDHALMLSGLDLYKRVRNMKNNKVLGLAWVNGMCREHFSCTLNEGSTFEAAFVIAHELGHSLGMLHDGRGNACNPDRYIMSEKTGPGKVTWSPCSNMYVDNFLRKSSGSCLADTAASFDIDHERDGRLPGRRFPPEKQCQMALGKDYKPHTSSREPFNNICKELWCLSGLWATPAHPALDGSTCAPGKECLQGECTPSQTYARAEDTEEDTSTFGKVKAFVAEFLGKLRAAFKVLG